MILSALFFSAILGAESRPASILPSQASLQSERELVPSEEGVAQWIQQLKSEMIGGYMLKSDSRFAKAVNDWGPALTDDMRNKLVYRVEVRPVRGLPGVYAALFWDPSAMVKSLLRTDVYGNGGPNLMAGAIANGHELYYQESICACRGLNLRGEDCFKFHRSLNATPEKELEEETIFRTQILNPLFKKFTKGKGLVLISMSIRTFSLDTFSHELLHAYFIKFPLYRRIILNFLNTRVTALDRLEIERILGVIYDKSHAELMADEVQAYLLQTQVPAGQSDMLREFRPKYSRKLVQELKRANLLPPILNNHFCVAGLRAISKR